MPLPRGPVKLEQDQVENRFAQRETRHPNSYRDFNDHLTHKQTPTTFAEGTPGCPCPALRYTAYGPERTSSQWWTMRSTRTCSRT